MVDRDIEDFRLPDFDETPRREGYEEGATDDELQSTVRELWKTGLEVFIHQLLYRRCIYPHDTFCSTRFVGVECKINNNPGVLQYVSEALNEAVPLIFHKNSSDRRLREILIEIYDQTTEIAHEEFSLSFSHKEEDATNTGFRSSFRNNFVPSSEGASENVIAQVERDLRDLVRSTGKLERPHSLVWDDSVSFKIVLGFYDAKNHNETLTPTQIGLNGSKWTESRTTGSNCRPGNRVLHNLPNFKCQFQYRLTSRQKIERNKIS